ncbi:UDP-3-O-(3-hydroxymyristoyl)glucosamine N-acyltransferase [Comamonas testosteroni]|uniref:UDP-3-O-acylglucosamine N-acyltransferase n=1 Tax=Comamonas testosteroni TaxID=285 RepID=A0A373FKK6_COMTE|nr:UDP-3-O-(3-hydroxymyristoyl)glucosamine N-acyltransferase [Comamonas testosteroni]RGE44711.1 UDP-3-O-(3-hydroxymyristoyl)glucosamine N-acyltransferase [Comamonas testosteroni]
MSVLLGQILDALGGELVGGVREIPISRIAPLDSAGHGDLSFLSNPRYRQQLAASQAACVIVAPAMRDEATQRGACIVTADPYAYFARATQWWRAHQQGGQLRGVHPSAVVDAAAQVHESAYVGPLCAVGAGAVIGAGTVLKSRVTISEDCMVGERCIVHAGVVIGADGFGFAPSNGRWEKIEQLGRVRVGNDVEIGANTCIDRGALDDTIIEDGVKIDNLVQIAHNVHIGAHTVIAGNTGIAGSARIGKHCQIGGAANILGHLTIADGTVISPTSMVTRSLPKAGFYTGIFPLQENEQWEKNAATFRQLYALRERVKKLEQTLAEGQRSNNGN